MASVGLEPHLVNDTSLLSLPLYHLLVVGSLAQFIHLIFPLANCTIKIQQFLNHKTASIGLEPHLVNDTSLLSLPLDHLLVVGRQEQLIHLIFPLANCTIKIQQFFNHKTASVRFRQHLVNDTSLLSLPLDQLLVVGSLPQFIHLIFSSSLYIHSEIPAIFMHGQKRPVCT